MGLMELQEFASVESALASLFGNGVGARKKTGFPAATSMMHTG